LVAIGAAGGVLFAWGLPDLGDTRGVGGALTWLAFAGRTFAFHAGLALLPLIVLMVLRRVWTPAIVASLAAAWCLAPALWSYRPRAEPPALSDDALTIFSVNAQVGRVDPERLRHEIERVDADVVCIIEHHPRLAPTIAALRERYPHVAESIRDDAFGMAMLSKSPLAEPPRHYPDLGIPLREPQIRCVVDVGGRAVVVQGVHTLPPVSIDSLREQRALLRALAAWARAEPRPVVLCGDLNCTPESQGFAWLRDAGLIDAWGARGVGRGATWPVGKGLFSHAGVRIDHILVGGGLVPASAVLGADVGSDHRGVVARVGFPAPGPDGR
jgi:endonuclease/exonuclease/phosphatase (EEP) superfamily protein YafD